MATTVLVDVGSKVPGINDAACLSVADGASMGAGSASIPSLTTAASPPPSLTSEDLGHTVCAVPATDKAPCCPGPLG